MSVEVDCVVWYLPLISPGQATLDQVLLEPLLHRSCMRREPTDITLPLAGRRGITWVKDRIIHVLHIESWLASRFEGRCRMPELRDWSTSDWGDTDFVTG